MHRPFIFTSLLALALQGNSSMLTWAVLAEEDPYWSLYVWCCVFYVTGLERADWITSQDTEVSAAEGRSVSLRCSYNASSTSYVVLYWFRQYPNKAHSPQRVGKPWKRGCWFCRTTVLFKEHSPFHRFADQKSDSCWYGPLFLCTGKHKDSISLGSHTQTGRRHDAQNYVSLCFPVVLVLVLVFLQKTSWLWGDSGLGGNVLCEIVSIMAISV